MRKALLVLLVLNPVLFSVAQTRVTDSLRGELYRKATGMSRLPVLLALGKEQQSLNRDTAYEYAAMATALAAKGTDRDRSLAALYLSQSYLPWGWIDSALVALEPAFALNTVDNSETRDVYFQVYRQKAMLYGAHTRYKEALDILYRLIREATTYNNPEALAANLNTIGSIAVARGDHSRAAEWFYKALAVPVSDEHQHLPVLTAIYINLADVWGKLNRNDSARYYLDKALPLARMLDNLYILSVALRVRINVFAKAGLTDEAEASFKELQAVNRKTLRFNVSDANLAMIDFYITTQQYDKAIQYCKNQIEGSDGAGGELHITSPAIRLSFYQALAKCYQLSSQHDLYRQTLEQIIDLKDSVYERTSAKEIADIQARYDAQLKESAIIEKQRLDIVRGNYLSYGLVALFVLAIISGAFLLNANRKRHLLKTELIIKEEKQLAEEAVRDAQEKERRRIAADLHDNLGSWAASMASNINYLDVNEKDEQTKNAFAELKAGSGAMIAELNDTIWVLKKESLSITAISDRLKIFINRLNKSYPGVAMRVTEHISVDKEFSASQAFHLYRIVQEALNNALKHSGASEIVVEIQSGENWKIVIIDNGSGFIRDSIRNSAGNGLANMEARCRENGWQIIWKKTHTSGTEVEVCPNPN